MVFKLNVLPAVFSLIIISSCSQKPAAPPAPLYPLPSEAQLAWHEMEMNAFIHFTINTFTDLEWGMGNESPTLFNPTKADPDQWVNVLKEAGFKGVILTCKHHDGFCLWPTKYTDHSIKSSPYKNGNGDLVKEVADACKKYDLKFGVYLSPWDRNHAEYGRPPYLEYYRNQLKEIFTTYGPIFEMWFDGANGGDGYYGGANEKRRIDGSTYYEWPETMNLVKELEPNIIFFSDAGPGVRWVGNERGIAGETNWNMITPDTLYAGKGGIENLLQTGSENGTHWIPAEVDVSIRPGWFYHEKEDALVKTPEQLFDIYLTSVGRGSTLLLNVPPDRRGLVNEIDVNSLKEWRKLIDKTFAENLARDAKVTATNYRGEDKTFSPEQVTDKNKNSYWATDDEVKQAALEFDLSGEKEIHYILMQEYIRLGQRVKNFHIEVWNGTDWKQIAAGTTIGYKRIIKLDPVKASRLKIIIDDARACPLLSNVEIY